MEMQEGVQLERDITLNNWKFSRGRARFAGDGCLQSVNFIKVFLHAPPEQAAMLCTH